MGIVKLFAVWRGGKRFKPATPAFIMGGLSNQGETSHLLEKYTWPASLFFVWRTEMIGYEMGGHLVTFLLIGVEKGDVS